LKEFYRDKIKDLLRPGYYFCKDIIDFKGRERLKKNIVLNDLYLGKRIFLLLTGESLQQIDISKLKNEYTFGAGLIFVHGDIGKIDLTFYMNIDASNSIAFMMDSPYWPKSYLGPLGSEGIVQCYREIDKRLGNKTILILHSDNYKCIENNNFFFKSRLSQPLSSYSAGCIFKNPETYCSAAMLIDKCNLKGKTIGDAMVSKKHANFIINKGNATSQDVLNLIAYIKEKIFQKTNILLETEVKYVKYI